MSELYELGFSTAECAAEPRPVQSGQGAEISYCVGKGMTTDDHALRYSRIEHWCQAAFSLVEDPGSTEENRRISALTVVTPGIYHVSAGMRFGREDKLHAWGITLNSHRSGEKNVIGMGQAFVLGRALHRETIMDEGSYTTLSWTGFLQKGDVLQSLVEPQQYRQYQGIPVEWIGFLRAHFLAGVSV